MKRIQNKMIYMLRVRQGDPGEWCLYRRRTSDAVGDHERKELQGEEREGGGQKRKVSKQYARYGSRKEEMQ